MTTPGLRDLILLESVLEVQLSPRIHPQHLDCEVARGTEGLPFES